MAILSLENGETLTDFGKINTFVNSIGVELSQWQLPEDEQLTRLLEKDQLNDSEKLEVLSYFDSRFSELKKNEGYQTQDLIVIHNQIPNIDEMLAKFDKSHTHDDDEVRYIVAGSGIFGFIFKDEQQAALTVQAGEYIRVPKNTDHWFILTAEKKIKAVRYFSSTEGWVPKYTGHKIRV